MVKYYEGMFLTHNKEARKDTDYLAAHVSGLIEKVGGTVLQMTKWDERRLAYPVKGVTHGVYFLAYFSGDAATDARLRAEVRLSSLILRHLTLHLEELPEQPIETFSEMQLRLSGGEARTALDIPAPGLDEDETATVAVPRIGDEHAPASDRRDGGER